MKAYKRLTLYERQKIEEGLDAGLSFRGIAALIGRNVTTVSREVKANRSRKDRKGHKGRAACRQRGTCRATGICKACAFPGTVCRACPDFDCRGRCPVYRKQVSCGRLDRAPWVCNGCPRRPYGCGRPTTMSYKAHVADTKADELRRESRRGFDMDPERARKATECISDCLARGLSPYEASAGYAEGLGVSESTIYRMVEAGIGGLANIQLERKVSFRPRNHARPKSSTRHAKARSYGSFCMLDSDRQASAVEMDCMEGRKCDAAAALTLYVRPAHLQIPLLLAKQAAEEVERALLHVKGICPEGLFEELFATVLTDNGGEFKDELALDGIFGGSAKDPHLFYCDPRRSDQKGRCEKNHSELRQVLPKGRAPFDELDAWDMATAASHVNSNPRRSLGGKSPIQMFKFLYGAAAGSLLERLGIEEVPIDGLMLKPEVLDIERERRGLPPIDWQ